MKCAMHKLCVSNSAAVSEIISSYYTSFERTLAALKLCCYVWHFGASSILRISMASLLKISPQVTHIVGFPNHFLHTSMTQIYIKQSIHN